MNDSDLDRLVHLNFAAFFRDALGFADHGVIHEEDGVMLWAGTTDFPVMTNGVARLDDSRPAAAVLEAARDFFGPRRRGYTVFTTSRAADRDLDEGCRAAFSAPLVDMPELVCPQRVDDKPVADGVELRRVVDADGVRDFADVGAQAYATIGMPAEQVPRWFSRAAGVLEPHLCAVVAIVDGQAVSGAMANLSHGIGGVYWVGTVPAARGKALADACTRYVTNWAFDEGAPVVSLQASSQGEPIYRAMGYQDRYRYYGYVAPA
jgi:ribosomal protein S18 acetylase RimI-like enzyme